MSFWLNKVRNLIIKGASPFTKSLVSNMTFEISFKTPTIILSKQRVLLNPNFISTLSNEQLKAVIEHEMLHLIIKEFV